MNQGGASTLAVDLAPRAKAFRSDGPTKVAGTARYTVDVALPGMLHCALVRAPIAAGRIRGIDTSRARALPGVRAVLTADDVPSHRNGMVIRDQRLFAADLVRYEGEPIAAIAADTDAIARRAAALVELDLEPFDAIVDLDAAVADDARLIHPDWADYGTAFEVPHGGNVASQLDADPGGVDEAFAAAAHMVSDEFLAGRQYQAYLETKAAVVEYDSGRYTVHVSHQYPFAVRDRLAEALGVAQAAIRVVGHHIGGGFGAKLELGIEPYPALLAKATRRPVRFVQERTEDLITCPSRENAVVRIRSAIDSDGNVLGREIDALLDAGAFATDSPFLCSIVLLLAKGAYRCGPVRVRARAVYTNTAPTGAFRGVSGAWVVFATERHMDHIANAVGRDPGELRVASLLDDGDTLPNGQLLDDASILAEAFGKLDEMAALPPAENVLPCRAADRVPGLDAEPLRGVGYAATVWLTNPMAGEATVRLSEDGTIRLLTAATDNGSGAVAVGLRQLAAEELGVEPDDVITTLPDTDTHGYDGGSQGSRTTFVVGRAVCDAATELRAKILDIAGDLLEAAVEDLELVEGSVGVRGVPVSRIPLATIAATANSTTGSLAATSSYAVPTPAFDAGCARGLLFSAFPNHTYHAHRAEVAVDPITGRVDVTRYLVAQEVGHAINPRAVVGQIQGAVTQGLGYGLWEAIDIGDDGRYRQRTLSAYRLPLAVDVPEVEVALLEHPSATGPHGAKGVAEPPLVPVAAAVANAVSAAIGAPITRVPIRPDDVLEAIETAARSRS